VLTGSGGDLEVDAEATRTCRAAAASAPPQP
jgi:hypothetical protein